MAETTPEPPRAVVLEAGWLALNDDEEVNNKGKCPHKCTCYGFRPCPCLYLI
jgi:hypothetical protein